MVRQFLGQDRRAELAGIDPEAAAHRSRRAAIMVRRLPAVRPRTWLLGKLNPFHSANTIRSHTRAIYRKLAVNSRAEAVARADALGLLARPPSA
jgi:hypothetical protein